MKTLNATDEDEDEAEIEFKGNDFEKEFVDAMKRRAKDIDAEQEVIQAFRTFDKYGNGTVSTCELRHIMLLLGENIKEEEIDEFLMEAEIEGDGYINYEQFVRSMMSK